jgi:hypothetical protein
LYVALPLLPVVAVPVTTAPLAFVIGKDTNFRGLTIFDNVIYLSKGSGGNGVNTVYFIDTIGNACPSGVGVPQAGATLPTAGIPFDPALLQTDGVTPYNMCILKGFNTTLAKTTTDVFPFGMVCGLQYRVHCG